jgi:hypothetical protein
MKPVFTLKFGVGGVLMTHNGKLEPVTSEQSVPVLSTFRNGLPFSENIHHNLDGIKELRRKEC